MPTNRSAITTIGTLVVNKKNPPKIATPQSSQGASEIDVEPSSILLQSTIEYADNDWHIGRFSLLAEALRSSGNTVTCRNRMPNEHGDDPVLAELHQSEFDQLWLFGADTTNGLSAQDAKGINALRRRGGGLLTARDHEDLGLCLRALEEVGNANFYHSNYPEPDTSRHVADDFETAAISWPNYRSGPNGDFQRIHAVQPVHELLVRDDGTTIRYFPAHPHEGAIGIDQCGEAARIIAYSTSEASDRIFNLIATLEPVAGRRGRAIVHSSFHHFADYNWDPRMPKPSFVTEVESDGMLLEPRALEDIQNYVRNAARWLGSPRK